MTAIGRFPTTGAAQADGRYGGILPAGPPDGATEGVDAVEVLASTIAAADRRVTVLTLGPLTNLAAALDADPNLSDRIDRVVVMGGAFEVPGNVFLESQPAASIAEWNIYADPVAAERVLQSGVKTTFVPLDAQVPVDAYVIREIGRAATTPASKTVAELLGSDPFFVSGQFFMWDPLAAVAVAEPELFTTREESMSIQSGGRRAGWTSLGGSAVGEIATVIDGDEFLSSYIATLDGRTSPVRVSREPDASIVTESDCKVTPSEVTTGPAVLALESPTPLTAAAIGVIDPARTDADIEAFFATAPTAPPAWFELTALLSDRRQPGERGAGRSRRRRSHGGVCLVRRRGGEGERAGNPCRDRAVASGFPRDARSLPRRSRACERSPSVTACRSPHPTRCVRLWS